MRRRKRPTPAELGLTAAEARILTSLRTPQRVQEYVSAPAGQFRTGRRLPALRARRAAPSRSPLLEAAFLAACALWLQGEPPLLMDLTATHEDFDHVVTLFRRDGCWGAISKSNHVWLRWRDPVYRSLRELAMSYFHEYFTRAARRCGPIRPRSTCAASRPTPGSPTKRIAGRSARRSTMPAITADQAGPEALADGADATVLRADDLVQYESRDRKTARKY